MNELIKMQTPNTAMSPTVLPNKSELQSATVNSAFPHRMPEIVHDVMRSPGQPLDALTRAVLEPRFGHDFSRVRVHTDARAAESAQAMNARAYTVGRNIIFAAGQYAPQTNPGRQLLAHELTHTVQQRFLPYTSKSNLSLGDPRDHCEQSAERMEAEGSLNRQRSGPRQPSIAPTTGAVIQRQALTLSRSAGDKPALSEEEPRLLAKFDMDNRRKRAWDLNQLTKEIGKAFLDSERAYVRILAVYPPNSKDPNAQEDARANALQRAGIVQQALHQWINPKKFPLTRYYTATKQGNAGDPDIELWLTHGPLVVTPQLGPARLSGTPSAAPEKSKPPSPGYSRPYPGTGMDAFRAFLSTSLGEKFKAIGKQELKKARDKTSVTEKIAILVSQLIVLGIGTYGLTQMTKAQQRAIIDLIIKDEDTSLLRPLHEKGMNLLELDLDADFRPRKLRPPMGEIDLP